MFHYGEPATTRDFRLYLIHTRDKRRNNRILPGWRRLALPASSQGSHRGQRGLGLRVLVQAVGTQGGGETLPDARAERPEDRGPTGRNFVSEKKM